MAAYTVTINDDDAKFLRHHAIDYKTTIKAILEIMLRDAIHQLKLRKGVPDGKG